MIAFIFCFQQVADLIGADPREIIFTSGATESNNIAIKGVSRFYKSKKKHVITTQTVSTPLFYDVPELVLHWNKTCIFCT